MLQYSLSQFLIKIKISTNLEKGSYKLPKITIINNFCINYKYHIMTIMTEQTFLKELISMKQVNQKSVIFATFVIF